MAFTLGGAPPAQRYQPRQSSIGRAIGRQAQHTRCIREIEPGADHQTYAGLARRQVSPHYPGQRIAIGNRDGRQTDLRRPRDQLLGMRRTAQKAEIAGDL